jgi:hypothetical protein
MASSGMLHGVLTRATRRNIPEDAILKKKNKKKTAHYYAG